MRPPGTSLARRIVEQSLPRVRRRRLHRAVVGALGGQARPERARIVYHADLAGDVPTLIAVGPAAAREAAAAGAHRRALLLFRSVLPHLHRLSVGEQAAVLDDYAWELHNVHRFRDAVQAGREAAQRYDQTADAAARGMCLVRLSAAGATGPAASGVPG